MSSELSEIQQERAELDSKYEGGLPSYLSDYFDKKEKAAIHDEFYRKNTKRIWSYSKEERREFAIEREENFWKNNKAEIIKSPLTTGKTVYEEPPKAELRVEEDKIEGVSNKLAAIACGHSLEAFGVRYFPHYMTKATSKFHKFLFKTLTRETHKKKGCKWAIAAPRGNAKCLDSNTFVQLYNGRVKKIKDVKVGDEVVCVNNELKLDKDVVSAVLNSGRKKVRRFTLSSGRNITMTDDHRLFDIHGEIEARDIKIGTKIATPRKLPCVAEDRYSISDDEVIFLANMLAEGCVTNTKYTINCGYTNFDEEVASEFIKSCSNLGFKVREVRGRSGQYRLSCGARDYIRTIGLDGCGSKTKFIPECIFLQNDDKIRLFLSRFIATDGWVACESRSVGITLANEFMIHQLFTLFLRVGLIPSIFYSSNSYDGAFALVIYRYAQLCKINKEFDLLHKHKKLEDVLRSYSGTKIEELHSNIDTIDRSWRKYLKSITPYYLRKNWGIRIDNKYHTSISKVKRVAEIDDNEFLKRIADSDIFWEEVVDISDYFYTETYDIETQKYHNFVANDIVSHNSTIISAIFPLWCICYNKKKFIILISDTLGQAEDFLADIKRELETNLMIQQDFPFAFGKGEMWRSDEIITRNGVKVKALGTGSKIRGRRFGTTRPSLVLMDDLESGEMVRSDVQRKFIRNQWFNKDVLFAGREDGTTDFYVVGTILGKDSLLNNLLDPEQYPDWSSVRFKAVEEFSDSPLWEEWAKIYKDRFNANRKEDALKFFEEHKEEMLEGTKVLWPEGDPYYNLMVYKLSDPSGFLMEKQNAPVDLTKVLVTKEDLHFENFNMPKVREDLEHAVYYGAIDPSLGKHSTSGDYSAIVTVARSTKTGYIYVVNMDIKRRSVDTQIDDIIRSFLRYKYHSFAIETNAFQYVMADTLRKKARKFGVNIPIVEVNQYKDKKLRFEGIVPLIIDGTIVFDTVRSSTSNMYAEGIEQIVTFTGENDEHDDAPDALQLSVDLAKAPRFRMIKRMAKNRRTRRR